MVKNCYNDWCVPHNIAQASRRILGLEEDIRFSEIDDQELDVFVKSILELLPTVPY